VVLWNHRSISYHYWDILCQTLPRILPLKMRWSPFVSFMGKIGGYNTLQCCTCSRSLGTSFELLTATIGRGPRYCGTFPLKIYYGGEKLEQNRGMGHRILTPNENFLTFRAPNFCAKFHKNRTLIATVGARTDRHADRSTDRRTQVILWLCPILCYAI